MSEIRLFRIQQQRAAEIAGTGSDLERPLQSLIESNLSALLSVRLIASEYSTGKKHQGRIDTLGLDLNNRPVIIEYKRKTGETVINQGLSYLNWLMDHQAEFKLLVLDRFGKSVADAIDWNRPRLICIASEFTKRDSEAIQQMTRNIQLIRYRQFGSELLLLELVNAVEAADESAGRSSKMARSGGPDKTVAEWLMDLSPAMRAVFDSLAGHIASLGDDVQRKDLRVYIAFKRLRNFAMVSFQKNSLILNLRLNPDRVALVEGFIRDMRGKGHWGTGDLDVTIRSLADLDKVKPLILKAYEGDPNAS